MQEYNDIRFHGEELPKLNLGNFVVIRLFRIDGVASKYYDVNCEQEVASTDDLAGAFDLRDWYRKHEPYHKSGVKFNYEVYQR